MIKIQTTTNLPKYQINSTKEKENLNFGNMTFDFNKNQNFLEFDNFDSLAKVVESGNHFTACTFNGNKSDANVDSISLFILDIDGTLSLEELNKRLELLFLEPNLMYYSISNIEKGLRYRVVFKNISPITGEEIEKYKNTIEIFTLMIFPEADSKSFSISQFWLGSKKDSVFKIDNNSFFDVFNLESKIISYYISLYGKNYKRTIIKILEDLKKNDSKLISKFEKSYLTGFLKTYTGIFTLTKDARERSQTDTTTLKNPNKNDIFIKNNLKYDDVKNKIFQCKLIADFMNSERKLSHTELYHLANNFFFISGGTDVFLNNLRNCGIYNHTKISEMEAHFKYLRTRNLNGPTYCHFKRGKENNCPYFDSCPKNNNVEPAKHNILHLTKTSNSYSKVKNVNIDTKIKKSLIEVREELINKLNEIKNNDKNEIYVIKSACGSGKSYWNKNSNLDDVVIAVKTLAILDEYRDEFQSVSRPPVVDALFDRKIKNLKEKNLTGIIKEYKNIMNVYFNRGDFDKYNEIKNYLEECYNIYKGNKVVTTHANFFNNLKNYNQKTIIIDEDPIDSILKIKSVKLSDITKIIKKIESNTILNEKYFKIKVVLKKLKNIKENKLNKINILKYVDEKVWDECFNKFSNIYDSPMISMKKLKYYIKTDNGNLLFCENKVDLPKDRKIIIQSATIDEKMAKLLYGENINFIEINTPELIAKLMQDEEHSYSRVSTKEQLNNFKLQEKIERIKEKCNIDYIISFLSTKDEFIDDDIEFLNFGATTGINSFTGLNGIVIGNPYPNPERVKLIAAAITDKINYSDKMKFDFITRGKTVGKVNLFENEIMKTIQINLIETEIIQSVGRSRVYEEKCEIYLLSSFPFDGSIVEKL